MSTILLNNTMKSTTFQPSNLNRTMNYMYFYLQQTLEFLNQFQPDRHLPLHRYLSFRAPLMGWPDTRRPMGREYIKAWNPNQPKNIRVASRSNKTLQFDGSLGNFLTEHWSW